MSTSSAGPTMTQLRNVRRYTRRVTQEAVARILGVCHSQVCTWETGKRTPRWNTAVALAGALDTRIYLTDSNGAVLAQDEAIPQALARIIGDRGPEEVARAARVTRTPVRMFCSRARTRPGWVLTATVERYAKVVGCAIVASPRQVTS